MWLQALGELCSSPSPSPSPFLHPLFLVFAETCENEGSERKKKKDTCLEIHYEATISHAPYLHGNLHEFLWDTLISYFLTNPNMEGKQYPVLQGSPSCIVWALVKYKLPRSLVLQGSLSCIVWAFVKYKLPRSLEFLVLIVMGL